MIISPNLVRYKLLIHVFFYHLFISLPKDVFTLTRSNNLFMIDLWHCSEPLSI